MVLLWWKSVDDGGSEDGLLDVIGKTLTEHQRSGGNEQQDQGHQVIKWMAYGYRDSFYFFLKVKDAFPAKTR
jgi:hypothetical protein